MENLILGAGFLSRFIAAHTANVRTISVCRSVGKVSAIGREEFFHLDILDKKSIGMLKPLMRNFKGYVFFLIPPSGFSLKNVKTTLRPLFDVLSSGEIKGVVLASSTGVYTELRGESVDNDTVAHGSTVKVKKLLEIENSWLSSPFGVAIGRLGGLYGGNRVIGSRSLRSGENISGTGQEYLNLIHAVDAARALLELTKKEHQGRSHLLTDRLPVKRREYYKYLAGTIGSSLPKFDGSKRGDYRCDSSKTWESLGIDPKFHDYKSGLRAAD